MDPMSRMEAESCLPEAGLRTYHKVVGKDAF